MPVDFNIEPRPTDSSSTVRPTQSTRKKIEILGVPQQEPLCPKTRFVPIQGRALTQGRILPQGWAIMLITWARLLPRGNSMGVSVCVRACVRACGAGIEPAMFRLEIDGTNRCTILPSTVSDVFLLLLYLWVVTNSQMCMSEFAWWEKKRRKKGGIVAGQNQPLGAVWCKARLFNSGGQFDRLCNLIDGAILAQALC